jgi:hypothetical protein
MEGSDVFPKEDAHPEYRFLSTPCFGSYFTTRNSDTSQILDQNTTGASIIITRHGEPEAIFEKGPASTRIAVTQVGQLISIAKKVSEPNRTGISSFQRPSGFQSHSIFIFPQLRLFPTDFRPTTYRFKEREGNQLSNRSKYSGTETTSYAGLDKLQAHIIAVLEKCGEGDMLRFSRFYRGRFIASLLQSGNLLFLSVFLGKTEKHVGYATSLELWWLSHNGADISHIS